MAFRTLIITEDIIVDAVSEKGNLYHLTLSCIALQYKDDPTFYVELIDVTQWQLAALHMLMLCAGDISKRLEKDLYEIVEPLLAKLGDSPCRPIP